MSFSTATIQSSATLIAVDTRSIPKVVYLPTVSTNQGRLLILKDYFGTATNSTITVSTTGTDLIDDLNWTAAIRSSFTTMSMVSDGLRSWRITGFYTGNSTPGVVTSNLVYYLDAGNTRSYPGSGSTWSNLTGTGRNITLYNSPTYNSSNGGYLSFVGGSSQYGDSATSLPYMSTFTLEAWLYYVSGSGGGCIVTETFPGTTSAMNYALGNMTGSWPNVQVGYYTGSWQASGTFALTANNWFHIVGTYDGAALRLYVNNGLRASNANATVPQSNTGGFRLMRRWDFAEYLTGYLAVYRTYNRALTATEVSQNFNQERQRFGL